MALTGKFVADFGSFVDAVEKANIKLVDFGKGASGVESRLNSMTDNFSGRKIIQEVTLMSAAIEAAGGVTTLTASELEKVGNKSAEAAEKLKKLGIEVPPELQKLADSTKSVSGTFNDLSQRIVGVAAGFVSAEAVVGLFKSSLSELTSVVTESVSAYSESEAANVKLVAALKQHSLATPEVIAQYDGLATAFQNTTVHADEQFTAMEALLTQVGGVLPSAMEGALKASADLSAGLGIDLHAATLLVAKAAAGHTETLGRYGITVSQADIATQGFSAVLEAVNRQFGGQAAAQVDTYAGKIEQLKNSLNNVEEAIGKLIVKDPLIEQGLARIADAAKEADKSSSSFGGSFVGLAHDFGILPPEIALAILGLEGYAAKLNDIDRLNRQIDSVPSPFAKIAKDSQLSDLTGAINQYLAKLNDADAAQRKHQDEIEKSAEAQAKFKDQILGTIKPDQDQIAALESLVKGLVVGTEQYDRTRDAIGRMIEKGIQVPEFLKNWYDANRPVLQITSDFSGALAAMTDVTSQSGDNLHNLTAYVNEFHDGITVAGDEIATVTIPMFGKLAGNVAQNAKAAHDFAAGLDEEHSSLEGLAKDLSGLSSEFAKLAQISGGSFGGVVKNVGQQIGEFSLLTKATQQFKDAQGDASKGVEADYGKMAVAGVAMGASAVGTFESIRNGSTNSAVGIASLAAKGAAIGSIIPGIGTAIGGAIGAVAGVVAHFTKGVSQAEKDGRDLEAQFEATYGGFQGMIDKIGGVYADTGRSAAQAQADVAALFAAEKQGPDAVKAAIEKIGVAFTEQKAKIDADTSALGVLLKSGQDLGVTLPKSLQDSIQKLIDLGKVTGDTKDILATLSGGTTVSFATMRDIASKYGADLEALGPKFEAAKIGDTAAGIINDFDTLQRGLDDTDEALTVLRKPINDLVNDSLKFGVAIPANFKPWVEQLEKTGQLTDENGNKLDDLSALKFADPIKTQFDILIDAIQKLVDKITGSGGLNAAIDGIPDKTVHVGFEVDNQPDFSRGDASAAYTGGLVGAFGVQRLAGGGRVLPFPGSPSGIDTVPIWAAPGEGMVTQRGMATIGASGLAAINSGRGLGGTTMVDNSALQAEIAGLRQDLADSQRRLPKQLRDAGILKPRAA